MSDIVYLAVLHDRHTDDTITAHRTLFGARKRCDALMRDYDRYSWVHHTSSWQALWTTSEDGPWIHIERVLVTD